MKQDQIISIIVFRVVDNLIYFIMLEYTLLNSPQSL